MFPNLNSKACLWTGFWNLFLEKNSWKSYPWKHDWGGKESGRDRWVLSRWYQTSNFQNTRRKRSLRIPNWVAIRCQRIFLICSRENHESWESCKIVQSRWDFWIQIGKEASMLILLKSEIHNIRRVIASIDSSCWLKVWKRYPSSSRSLHGKLLCRSPTWRCLVQSLWEKNHFHIEVQVFDIPKDTCCGVIKIRIWRLGS
jgi:hypothetical protein